MSRPFVCNHLPYAKHRGVGVAPGHKIPKSNPCNSASNLGLRFLAALSLPPARTGMRVRAVLAARAESMMAQPMECHCFSATQVPRTTHLYSTYITDFPKLADFFAHAPTLESVLKVAGETSIDRQLRTKVAGILRAQNRAFGADAAVEAALDQFAGGATAIVSGQQVGLFSGPSYTIYKALSALRLAEELRKAGKPAVALFWLATEDHDLAEINHCLWPERGGSQRLELPSEGQAKRRVGELALGDPVSALVEQAVATLQGPAATQLADALRASYRPQETYGSAFGKLLARLFAGTGLILLDPLSPELHALAAPLYRAALEQHSEIAADLLARSKTLARRGFHAQVKVTEQTTLLFVDQDGERVPLRARNGDFSLGRRTMSLQQPTELLDSAPALSAPTFCCGPSCRTCCSPLRLISPGPPRLPTSRKLRWPTGGCSVACR